MEKNKQIIPKHLFVYFRCILLQCPLIILIFRVKKGNVDSKAEKVKPVKM